MERRRIADNLLINKTILYPIIGDEPSPLHVRFQAAPKCHKAPNSCN